MSTMRGSVLIEMHDFGQGNGLEPIIEVKIDGRSNDLRDRLLKQLFQNVSLDQQDSLAIKYVNALPVTNDVGEPELVKTIILYKPIESDIKSSGMWIDILDRSPELGRLVYTKDKNSSNATGVYALTKEGWNSKLSTSNEPITHWFDE